LHLRREKIARDQDEPAVSGDGKKRRRIWWNLEDISGHMDASSRVGGELLTIKEWKKTGPFASETGKIGLRGGLASHLCTVRGGGKTGVREETGLGELAGKKLATDRSTVRLVGNRICFVLKCKRNKGTPRMTRRIRPQRG